MKHQREEIGWSGGRGNVESFRSEADKAKPAQMDTSSCMTARKAPIFVKQFKRKTNSG